MSTFKQLLEDDSFSEFIERLKDFYNKTTWNDFYNAGRRYLESAIFYGDETPEKAIKGISETLKYVKEESKYLKSKYKEYKPKLLDLEKNPDPNDKFSYTYNRWYAESIKETKIIIDWLNLFTTYIKGFKKVKKFKPFSNWDIYDDSIVVCYNEFGEEIYKGEWDYSPAKEYEKEHDGTYSRIALLSKYHKNKDKNVEIIWEEDVISGKREYKIHGYYGFI